jgi:hypothetical protein
MLDEITMEMIQATSFLPLPADYLMAGPNSAGGSSPKGDIEESRDESGLGSGAGADPLKESDADKPGNDFQEAKDDHNDDGLNDNKNPNVITSSPPEEDFWGDIGAGMG